jgi:phage major head subunit gpT-like protein
MYNIKDFLDCVQFRSSDHIVLYRERCTQLEANAIGFIDQVRTDRPVIIQDKRKQNVYTIVDRHDDSYAIDIYRSITIICEE